MKSLEIHVLNVGTADAILIVYRDDGYKHVTVLDSGTRQHSDALAAACWRWAGGVVDLLVLSHSDGDHVGGALNLVRQVTIREVLADDPQLAFNVFGLRLERADSAIRERVDCLREGADVVKELRRKLPVWTPGPGFRPAPHLIVLGPSNAFWAACMSGRVPNRLDLGAPPFDSSLDADLDVDDDSSPINQSSIVLGLEFDGKRFLFPGDAGRAALLDVFSEGWRGLDNLFWLQLPHHGSRHSLSSGLIRRFRPALAVVSAGGADEDHPHSGVVRALRAVGSSVYRSHFSWWSDGVLRPGFVPARPVVASPSLAGIEAILRVASPAIAS